MEARRRNGHIRSLQKVINQDALCSSGLSRGDLCAGSRCPVSVLIRGLSASPLAPHPVEMVVRIGKVWLRRHPC